MKRCIYCGKDQNSTSFNGREHVIPSLLGTFDNNLILTGSVCDICNSRVFGPLENRFKEDTEEGVTCQMINFSRSYQIRIRNKNFKISGDLGLGDTFFNEIFPFFKLENGRLQITFVPQIKVRGYAGGGYLILLIDDIIKLPRARKRFKKLKNLMEGVKSKDVSIFTYGGDDPNKREFNQAVKLVRELGVPYQPGTQRFVQPSDSSAPTKGVVFNLQGTIDTDMVRVVAKIAFNYFAYCAVKEF